MKAVDLETVDALDEFLAAADGPVLLYKHSATCGTSAFAHDEIRRLKADAGGPSSVGIIVVQSARRVSNEVARRFAVRHESPQVLLVHEGRVLWTASHFRVTAEAVQAAMAASRHAPGSARVRN